MSQYDDIVQKRRIFLAAEEWGISTYRVKQKVKEWEDSWH